MDDITPKKKRDRIEELDRDLYDPAKQHGQRPRRDFHDREIDLPTDFPEETYEELIKAQPKYRLPTSFYKKVFLGVLGFFVLTVLVAGVSLYQGRTTVSEDLIAVELLGQPFVDGGEPLELQVRIQNFNEQTLELPDLVISYPKDSAIDAERVFLRRSLKDIEPKARVTETFNLTLFGQEGDTRDIQATLEYRIAGSSSIFVKEVAHEIIIRSTPTELTIDAPTNIVRNQEIVFGVEVASNSTTQINDAVMIINYPQGFEFLGSNVQPGFNNNTWYVDNVTDEPERIEVRGRLAALEGQGQSFQVSFGKQSQLNKNHIETVFNAVTHTVEVEPSFINANLVVNGNRDASSTLRGGAEVSVILEYENTLDEALENAIITLHLDGNLYDPSRVSLQNGFYSSSAKTITFDQTTASDLALLQPGESGSFRFTLFSNPLVGPSGVLTNPSIELSVDVEGTEMNGQNRRALEVASHRVNANSDITVVPSTLHYDGPFNNSGPMPPRVGLPTTYTLIFQVTNSSNDVSDAELTTFLPNYVTWQNAIAPSVERGNVSFDTTTRKLTWDLGNLKAGLGVGSSQPRSLSIQVQLTPSATQVGNQVELTDDIILKAIDDLTETNLEYKKVPMTTRLSNTSAVGADGRVVQ